MTGVVVNSHFFFPESSVTDLTGLFEITCQCAGAIAEKAKVAFKSGWSKQGYMFRMKAVSP